MANARALSLHLEQELARCRREHATVAVMVCDLNGFKEINDRYGHLAGDKVLKTFANLIREVCREYDYAARMGGDEFVIVAPNMPPGSVSERSVLLSSLAQQASRDSMRQRLSVAEPRSSLLSAGWFGHRTVAGRGRQKDVRRQANALWSARPAATGRGANPPRCHRKLNRGGGWQPLYPGAGSLNTVGCFRESSLPCGRTQLQAPGTRSEGISAMQRSAFVYRDAPGLQTARPCCGTRQSPRAPSPRHAG